MSNEVIAVIVVIAIIWWLKWVSASICPGCGRANSKHWKHRRKDGRPDGRYAHNPFICTGCGHAGPGISRSQYRQSQARYLESSARNQARSSEAPPRPHAPASAQRAWLSAGEPVEVAGRRITCGVTYIINAAKDQHPYTPSTIIRGLPVGHAGAATPLGYWPNYYFFTPAQRGAYLDWLAQGRKDPHIDIGYVFVALYGLEWRALVEGAGLSEVSQELMRLVSIYGGHASFRTYAFNLLAAMLLGKGARIRSLEPLVRLCTEHPAGALPVLLLDGVVWHHAGAHLPFFWAREIALASGAFRKGVAIERNPQRFHEVFAGRFAQIYPQGLPIPEITAPEVMSYQWALRGSPKDGMTIPITGLLFRPGAKRRDVATGPFWNGLQEVWSQVVREVTAEMRSRRVTLSVAPADGDLAAVRVATTHPTGSPRRGSESLPSAPAPAPRSAPTAESAAFQPTSLRTQDRVESWYEDHADDQGLAPISLGALYAMRHGASPAMVTPTRQNQMIEHLEHLGLALEPDLRPHSRRASQDEARLVYRPNVIKRPSAHCQSLRPLVETAVAIALSDGEVGDAEMEEIILHIDQKSTLPEHDRVRLRTYATWLITSKQIDHGFNRLRHADLSLAQKKAIAALSIAIVLRDGKVTDKEQKALGRLYRALDLPDADLDAMLKPPIDARSGVTIDWNAVARLQAETTEVQGMLAQALSPQDEAPSEVSAPPSPPAAVVAPERAQAASGAPHGTAAFPGLDLRATRILLGLSGKGEISAGEFKVLCTGAGLMPSAAIDLINEWSDEHLGDRCIDGDGPYQIATHLLATRNAP